MRRVFLSPVSLSLVLGLGLLTPARAFDDKSLSFGLSSHHTWLHSDYTPSFGATLAYRHSFASFFNALALHLEADAGANLEGHWYGTFHVDLVYRLDFFRLVPYAGLSFGALAREVPSAPFRMDPTVGPVLGLELRNERERAYGLQVRYDLTVLDLSRTTGPLRLNLYMNFYF